MEISITLSSIEAQKTNSHNKPENFTIRLDKPLELDKNKKYLIGLDSGIMHYSWYNISPDRNNDKIEYKVNDTDSFKELSFSPGMYDYSDIEDYIDGWLVNEGIITKRDIKKRADGRPPITIELNLATYRCSLNLEENYSVRFGKEFGNLIGFEPGTYSGRNIGTKSPDITNSLDYLYIHCNLTNDSIVDGKYGDVIQMVPTTDKERSYPFVIEPIRVSYHLLNTSIIEEINIYITDPLGRLINLNNVHTSFNLLIKEF